MVKAPCPKSRLTGYVYVYAAEIKMSHQNNLMFHSKGEERKFDINIKNIVFFNLHLTQTKCNSLSLLIFF